MPAILPELRRSSNGLGLSCAVISLPPESLMADCRLEVRRKREIHVVKIYIISILYHQYIIQYFPLPKRKKWRKLARAIGCATFETNDFERFVHSHRGPTANIPGHVSETCGPQFKKILKDWFEHSKMPARKSWTRPFLAAEANCWISFFV